MSVRVATPVVVSLGRTLTGGVMDIVVLDPDTVVERAGEGEAQGGRRSIELPTDRSVGIRIG